MNVEHPNVTKQIPRKSGEKFRAQNFKQDPAQRKNGNFLVVASEIKFLEQKFVTKRKQGQIKRQS